MIFGIGYVLSGLPSDKVYFPLLKTLTLLLIFFYLLHLNLFERRRQNSYSLLHALIPAVALQDESEGQGRNSAPGGSRRGWCHPSGRHRCIQC